MGRSYGGIVLELEPTEAERLLVAYDPTARQHSARLDQLLRAGDLDAAAAHTDRLVGPDLGLTKGDLETLHSVWIRLRDRRAARGRSNRLPESNLAATA